MLLRLIVNCKHTCLLKEVFYSHKGLVPVVEINKYRLFNYFGCRCYPSSDDLNQVCVVV